MSWKLITNDKPHVENDLKRERERTDLKKLEECTNLTSHLPVQIYHRIFEKFSKCSGRFSRCVSCLRTDKHIFSTSISLSLLQFFEIY